MSDDGGAKAIITKRHILAALVCIACLGIVAAVVVLVVTSGAVEEGKSEASDIPSSLNISEAAPEVMDTIAFMNGCTASCGLEYAIIDVDVDAERFVLGATARPGEWTLDHFTELLLEKPRWGLVYRKYVLRWKISMIVSLPEPLPQGSTPGYADLVARSNPQVQALTHVVCPIVIHNSSMLDAHILGGDVYARFHGQGSCQYSTI